MTLGPDADVGVDVDGDDFSLRTGELSQKRGVVAGAGTDLEDAVTWVHIELPQHVGHDRGLAGGADGNPVRSAVGHDG